MLFDVGKPILTVGQQFPGINPCMILGTANWACQACHLLLSIPDCECDVTLLQVHVDLISQQNGLCFELWTKIPPFSCQNILVQQWEGKLKQKPKLWHESFANGKGFAAWSTDQKSRTGNSDRPAPPIGIRGLNGKAGKKSAVLIARQDGESQGSSHRSWGLFTGSCGCVRMLSSLYQRSPTR